MYSFTQFKGATRRESRMKAITDKYGVERVITATNEANERQVEQMVGKAMCAYANWQMTEKRKRERGAVIACQSEYEATVRCIAMFVDQPTSYICSYVIARCSEEFGI